jgi:hypothetical protein
MRTTASSEEADGVWVARGVSAGAVALGGAAVCVAPAVGAGDGIDDAPGLGLAAGAELHAARRRIPKRPMNGRPSALVMAL